MKAIFSFIIWVFHRFIFRSVYNWKLNRLQFNTRLYDSKIGVYNYFGPGVIGNSVHIGNYCSIAPYVVIGGMEHDYNKPSTSTYLFKPNQRKITIIEDDVWIGSGSVIRSGVKLGRGCVVGANTTVLKNVEPYEIVVGSPARNVKSRLFLENGEEIKNIDYTLNPKQILDIINKNNDYPQ